MLLAVVLFTIPRLVAAQSGALPRPQEDPAERLMREERQRARDRQQEIPRLALPRVDDSGAEDVPIHLIVENGPAYRVTQIVVNGNRAMASGRIARVIAEFVNRELGANRINALMRRLTRLYFESGFVAARVYLGRQNISGGTLELEIVEGSVEEVFFNGARAAGPFAWMMPLATGRPVSLWDLEQTLEHINRLPSMRAEAEVLPGTGAGASVLAVTSQQGSAWRGLIGLDELGNSATGRRRVRFGFEADNTLGVFDSLSLGGTSAENANSLLLGISIPFHYGIASYSLAYSEYINPIGDFALLFGDSRVQTLSWSQVLARRSRTRIAVELKLTHRHGRRFIDEVELTPQRLSSARMGISLLQRIGTGTLTADVGYSHGITAWMSLVDSPGLPRDAAHAQASRWDGTVAINWQPIAGIQARHVVHAQTSHAALFAADQIYIGGSGSVRGYAEGILVGDRGGYLRNEAIVRIGESRVFGSAIGVESHAGVDVGAAKQLFEPRFRKVAGLSTGLRLHGRRATAEASFARGVAASRGLLREGRISLAMNVLF